jgi:penicillin amidase
MRSRTAFLSVALIWGSAGCGSRSGTPVPPSAVLPQISGTIALEGLSAPVRVVRDRWGVPHIAAQNQDDLFFAQGFVQAQDRLFQMDLWRRSVQGRLSEVLGGNFIERDSMTRRVQFRGDLSGEWASYASDTQAIAGAFTRGINAWVSRARERLPEEFVLAGWAPEFWRPEDLLNRTDAFVASGNALDDLLRARLAAAVGVDRAGALFPAEGVLSTAVPRGLDLAAINGVVSDALRRVGTPPFFMGFAAAVGSNAWAVARSDRGAPLLAADPHVRLENPPPRYLVHLEAPGWHVAGATSPWLPGVVIGHNDRVAWGMTASGIDTQDVYVEKVNPANPRQVLEAGRWVDLVAVKDVIVVKGRPEPVPLEFEYTTHGPVIAIDPDRHLAYLLRWSGAEPGAAPELAALAIGRARSSSELRDALAWWKMPPAEFVYADVDGLIGRQVAALTPIRGAWGGSLPVPGESPQYEWRGWTALDRLPRVLNPPAGFVASANGNEARIGRIGDVLADPAARGIEGFQRLQQDVFAWNAERLVPLLARVVPDRADLDEVRKRLLRWDRRITAESEEATVYVAWERQLTHRLAALRLRSDLADEYLRRTTRTLVPALTEPSRAWFDGEVGPSRDRLLLEALAAAVDELRGAGSNERPAWGRAHTVTFAHPLGISARPARRFNVGPFAAGGYSETVLSISSPVSGRSIGPSFRAIFDLGDWDRSLAMNAPGQSESPGSPHFGDLAAGWAAGQYFPLAFSDRAVQANAQNTLMLVPR